MKIALGILAMCLLSIAVVVGIGYALPMKHTATRALDIPAPVDSVFALISTPTNFPTWRSHVARVENVVRPDGVPSYREIGKDGAILYVVVASRQNSQLVTRIADDKLPFGGTWTFDLNVRGDTTELRITEDGEVYNPVYRFVSRFVLGHHASIETYLGDVARRFHVPGPIKP